MDKRPKETRIKQLLFQSRHRGFAELDLLLGDFACAQLAQLSVAQLDEYEKLLNLQDWDVYNWLVGQAAPPADAPHAIIATIQAHMKARHGH